MCMVDEALVYASEGSVGTKARSSPETINVEWFVIDVCFVLDNMGC